MPLPLKPSVVRSSVMKSKNPAQGEPSMDTSNWRSQLPPGSRRNIVNQIMRTLMRHLPISSTEGLQELGKLSERFEEKIYTAASSQPEYIRKISVKMLTMETHGSPGSLQPNTSASTKPNPKSGRAAITVLFYAGTR